ncbi:MAG: LuxR C-terminal-related transcriptional regulator [Pseudomonadota bacterium]
MSTELCKLKANDLNLLLTIIDKLYGSHDRDTLRSRVAEDLLRLLKADYLASFIWNPQREVFEHVVFINMTRANLNRYDTYYHSHDPITPLLQKRRRATLVCEVMPQEELEKTEFFNDFLMRDGLHHGVNVYAYDGDLNIGDLRIWRAKHRPDFGSYEAALLDAILPHFTNALRNVLAIQAAHGIANFWSQLLDHSDIALFLFDESGDLVYRNGNAKAIGDALSEPAYSGLYGRVCSLARMTASDTQWGPYLMSVLPVLSPHDSRPLRAVMVHRSTPRKFDAAFLRTEHHLSPREAEISLLMFKGLTDQEIGTVLGISFHTVRTHLKRVFAKVGATTRSELLYHLLEGTLDISL